MRLYNNIEIPEIAFGTGVIKRFYRNKKLYFKDLFKSIIISIKKLKVVRRLKNDFTIKTILKETIKLGYFLIDTGRLYGHSEKVIGNIIKNEEREKLFIVSKVSDVDLRRYNFAPTVKDNLELTLRNLKTNYLDAYLLHFPQGEWLEMYKDIEVAYKQGKVKSIGVCNFDIDELEFLNSKVEIKPMICQVEIHPLNTKNELLEYCKQHNIVVMAHTPTGHMDKRITQSTIITKLAKKYNKTPAQLMYKWHIQKGIIPIVSSTSVKHLKNNIDIDNFELEIEEINEIDLLNENYSFDPNNNKMNDCPNFIYNI